RKTGEITTLPTSSWDQVIAVNLTGATMMVREVVKKMVETQTRPGVIVNMSSIARHGNRGQSNYVAAKAALAANTVTWAREFAPFGIRVGAIAPGFIDTPMTAGMHPKAREALLGMIPVGRAGLPEDVWLALKFIVECDFFNGRVVAVDGGMAARADSAGATRGRGERQAPPPFSYRLRDRSRSSVPLPPRDPRHFDFERREPVDGFVETPPPFRAGLAVLCPGVLVRHLDLLRRRVLGGEEHED